MNKAHGRIEQRTIEVLPAEAIAPLFEWPTIAQIAKVERKRGVKRKGQWVSENETPWLITSLTAAEVSPKALLTDNCDHWRIENKSAPQQRRDARRRRLHQPQRPSPTQHLHPQCHCVGIELAACFGLSPKIAIERCQDDKNLAIAWVGA